MVVRGKGGSRGGGRWLWSSRGDGEVSVVLETLCASTVIDVSISVVILYCILVRCRYWGTKGNIYSTTGANRTLYYFLQLLFESIIIEIKVDSENTTRLSEID